LERACIETVVRAMYVQLVVTFTWFVCMTRLGSAFVLVGGLSVFKHASVVEISSQTLEAEMCRGELATPDHSGPTCGGDDGY
jgi:hypothetical protein